jgi:hypothetical protein
MKNNSGKKVFIFFGKKPKKIQWKKIPGMEGVKVYATPQWIVYRVCK